MLQATGFFISFLFFEAILFKNKIMDLRDIEQYNNEIDAAMAGIDNGELTTNEDFEKEMDELFDDKNASIPDWQIIEITRRKEYYQQHPEELINWDVAQKMINTN